MNTPHTHARALVEVVLIFHGLGASNPDLGYRRVVPDGHLHRTAFDLQGAWWHERATLWVWNPAVVTLFRDYIGHIHIAFLVHFMKIGVPVPPGSCRPAFFQLCQIYIYIYEKIVGF